MLLRVNIKRGLHLGKASYPSARSWTSLCLTGWPNWIFSAVTALVFPIANSSVLEGDENPKTFERLPGQQPGSLADLNSSARHTFSATPTIGGIAALRQTAMAPRPAGVWRRDSLIAPGSNQTHALAGESRLLEVLVRRLRRECP